MKPSANLCLARNSFPDFDWIHSSHSSRLIFPSLFLSPLRAKEDAIYASWWRGSPVSSSSYKSYKISNISYIMHWYFSNTIISGHNKYGIFISTFLDEYSLVWRKFTNLLMSIWGLLCFMFSGSFPVTVLIVLAAISELIVKKIFRQISLVSPLSEVSVFWSRIVTVVNECVRVE